MSGNHPTLKNKVSPHLESQLPDFVREDHALFSLFLKYYYEFLEAGELTLTGSNEYVIEETLTNNFILSEDEEKVVLESSTGKFVVGETIVGTNSKATARVLVDDFDSNNRLFITSQQLFGGVWKKNIIFNTNVDECLSMIKLGTTKVLNNNTVVLQIGVEYLGFNLNSLVLVHFDGIEYATEFKKTATALAKVNFRSDVRIFAAEVTLITRSYFIFKTSIGIDSINPKTFGTVSKKLFQLET